MQSVSNVPQSTTSHTVLPAPSAIFAGVPCTHSPTASSGAFSPTSVARAGAALARSAAAATNTSQILGLIGASSPRSLLRGRRRRRVRLLGREARLEEREAPLVALVRGVERDRLLHRVDRRLEEAQLA